MFHYKTTESQSDRPPINTTDPNYYMANTKAIKILKYINMTSCVYD